MIGSNTADPEISKPSLTSLFGVECGLKGHFLFVFEDDMDLATLFYNLHEEVSCSVCSDLFTDPKQLSCLHSFCLKCLKGWYETCGGGDTIKCPKCQTLSRVPASGDLKDLPTSFYLNGLIDVLAIKECNKTQVKCGNCDKKNSEVSYCFQCCTFYCDQCAAAHDILRRNRGHRVLAIKEFQDKDLEDVLKRPVFCSRQDHREEELKYYCKECETALCQTCVTLDHGGHVLKLIKEEAESQKLEIKSVIERQKHNLELKMNVLTKLDKDSVDMIQQNEIVKRDAKRFADGLIKSIQAKLKNIITMAENKTKKSLESLKAKRREIQHQINVMKSSLEEAEKRLKRSTTFDVVNLKKSLQAMFQKVDQTKPIVHDSGSLQAFVFVKNQKMLDIVEGEEIGILKEGYRTKARETLAEGEGLKEGTVGRKAQFNLITRNAERKQWYDERDRVTVKIKDEKGQNNVTEVQINDNKDGMYNISYYPRVQGTLKLLIKVNGKYIAGSPFNVIVKPFHFNPVLFWGQQGSGDGMFTYPVGVAVNDEDEIVVADQGNHRVQVFDSNGAFLRSFGRKGENDGEFKYPFGIAIDTDRKIFVADTNNHRIQILSWEGRHLDSFGGQGSLDSQLHHPWGLSLDSTGNLIVADAGHKLIKIFTPDGRFVMKIGGQGSFSFPIHCVQCGEYFIVSDSNEHCVKVFNREGHFLYKFGKKGEGDGEFNCPQFLSVTQSKHLLVCDRRNNRIQVFKVDGTFVQKFGLKGSNLGQFNEPFSLALLSNDQVVVSDKDNHRIQIFA